MKTLLLILLLSLGCAKQVPVSPIIDRGTYFYWEIKPNVFGVLAHNGLALEDALRELQCGRSAVCAVQESGRRFFVERFPQ